MTRGGTIKQNDRGNPGTYSLDDLWIDVGAKVRIGVVSADLAGKDELFRIFAAVEDIESQPQGHVSREPIATISYWPDDLQADSFLDAYLRMAVLRNRDQMLVSSSSQDLTVAAVVDTSILVINRFGSRLLLSVGTRIPLVLNLSMSETIIDEAIAQSWEVELLS
jgi:hypothetical protein